MTWARRGGQDSLNHTACDPLPIGAGRWTITRSLLSTKRPRQWDHGGAGTTHDLLERAATRVLGSDSQDWDVVASILTAYLDSMGCTSLDDLSRDEALAYWLNIHSALVFAAAARNELGREHSRRGRQRFMTPRGEILSASEIFHGKIRRFGDPRVNAVRDTCPTRHQAPQSYLFTAEGLNTQLDQRMRDALAGGAIRPGNDGRTVQMAGWLAHHGSDFVDPGRMPGTRSVKAQELLRALRPWLPATLGGIADEVERIGVVRRSCDCSGASWTVPSGSDGDRGLESLSEGESGPTSLEDSS